MKHATPSVCLAYSDDEDYVSMDEDDLNTGITALYNVSSADEDDGFGDDDKQKDAKKKKRKKNRVKKSLPVQQPPPPPVLHHPLPPQSADANLFRPSLPSVEHLADTEQQPKPTSSFASWRHRFTPSAANPNSNNNNNSSSPQQQQQPQPPQRRWSMFGSSSDANANSRFRVTPAHRASVRESSPAVVSRSENLAPPPNVDALSQAPPQLDSQLGQLVMNMNTQLTRNPMARTGARGRGRANMRHHQHHHRHVRRSMSNESEDDSSNDDDADDHEAEVAAEDARVKLSKRLTGLRAMTEKNLTARASGKRRVIHKQKVNANIISVELGTLQQSAQNVATGDAQRCLNRKCGAILSKFDSEDLLKQHEELKLDDAESQSIWICKFCNHVNVIEIDAEEMPTQETVDYILEPAAAVNSSNASTADGDEKANQEVDEKQVIFCIDVSGSMCVSMAMQGQKLKLRGDRLAKQNEELAQFIDPNDAEQFRPNESREVTYVSRLQSVQAAVDEQLSGLRQGQSRTKVALVTFSNSVTVYGVAGEAADDAAGSEQTTQNVEVIAGDKLNDLEQLKSIGSGTRCRMTQSIGDSHDYLVDALWTLEESGQTALGPALVTSIAMASRKRGSQVILATDGLANVGVGAIEGESDEKVNAFYDALGEYALQMGVVVSIISISDDGCKLEALAKLVEATNGTLQRINPLRLTDTFSSILKEEIIATHATATMLLHPGLMFVDTAENLQSLNPFQTEGADDKTKEKEKEKVVADDDDDDAKNDDDDDDADKDKKASRQLYKIDSATQDIGNVMKESTVFFEYGVRKERLQEFQQLKQMPFQVRILYRKMDGTKMLRVITQSMATSHDRKKMRQNLDYAVLSKYGTRVTSKLCQIGDYEAARGNTNAHARYMHSNAMANPFAQGQQAQLQHTAQYVNSNIGLDFQMEQQQVTEQQQQMAMAPARALGAAPAAANSPWTWRSPQNNVYRAGVRNDQFSSMTYAMKKQ